MSETKKWLLQQEQPWVRLAMSGKGSARAKQAKKELLAHPLVESLIKECSDWPGEVLTNHKKVKLLIHRLSLLVDLGVTHKDPGMAAVIKKVKAHQDPSGAFQVKVNIPTVFGGDGKDSWNWMLCDAPLVVHGLLGLGLKDKSTTLALDHIAGLAKGEAAGWPCRSAFPKMRGPGKREDPCPYANLVCLRALSLSTSHRRCHACQVGVESLLSHWQNRAGRKQKMFGIGTDFKKLKYPMVWYDLLHVMDVLSRFQFAHQDKRFIEMRDLLFSKADAQGCFTPESVWMAYKGYDFAQKKQPSPTLTMAVERIRQRLS